MAVLEKREAVGAGASAGNSGLGHTGYDAPEGSLERSLLRRSIRLHQEIYRSFGLSYEHVRKCGSLVVAWTPEQLQQLPKVLQENLSAGDTTARLVGQEELRKMEPALSREALGAVYCPNEAVVEPWLVTIGYLESALRHGARLGLNREVTSADFDPAQELWTVRCTHTDTNSVARSKEGGSGGILTPVERSPEQFRTREGTTIRASVVVNCAGLYADRLEALKQGKEAVDREEIGFEVMPRKGQFVVFRPSAEKDQDDDDTRAPFYVIEPVPTQFTKGVIAWTTVYGNVVVGPTAVTQTSRSDRSTDASTIKSLKDWGTKVIPALKNAEVLGTYAGLRPATNHRDYQIRADETKRWITVAGVRSTGLSACSAIGEYVADMCDAMNGQGNGSWLEHTDQLPGVTESASSPLPLDSSKVKQNAQLPPLEKLAADYRESGDGTVLVYGKRLKVAHPLSSFGMESMDTNEE